MPKGVGIKVDYKKVNEKPHPSTKAVESDDHSPVDKGKDFVKPGERA